MPLQLVVRRKPRLKIFYRELPPTYFIPRDAQIHMRILFAEAAKKAKAEAEALKAEAENSGEEKPKEESRDGK